MSFKIQNENKMWVLYTFCSLLLIFPAMLIQSVIAISIAFIIVAAVTIVNLLNNTVKTKIEIEGDIMAVRHVVGTKKYNIADIMSLNYERYTQRRKRNKYTYFTDHRAELRIGINGRLMKYTDRACEIGKPKSFFSDEYESIPIPDEDVELYRLYKYLRGVTGLY